MMGVASEEGYLSAKYKIMYVLKEVNGGHTSHAEEVYQAAMDNSAILQKQLNLYNPDISKVKNMIRKLFTCLF